MPLRILIADDSALARKILRDTLKTNGYNVCGEAENGLEAVRMALSLTPDVVVLDLVMPELDGMRAAQKISQALPDTPMILHTLDVLPQLERGKRGSEPYRQNRGCRAVVSRRGTRSCHPRNASAIKSCSALGMFSRVASSRQPATASCTCFNASLASRGFNP